MGDLYKGKKPSDMTADEIEDIRESNSTKARMGEGKPPSPIAAGRKLYDSLKNIVTDSMAKTIEVNETNKKRVQTIKQPKPGANPSEILRKKK
jgi:hypothetical protein